MSIKSCDGTLNDVVFIPIYCFFLLHRSKESTLKKKKKSRLSAAEETGVERTIEIMK